MQKAKCYISALVKRASVVPEWPPEVEVTEDEVFCIYGYGPYQKELFHFGFLAAVALACNHLLSVVIAPDVVHRCISPQSATNLSLDDWLHASGENSSSVDECNIYIGPDNATGNFSIVACNHWEYPSHRPKTVVDQGWLVSLSASVYMLGSLLGLIIFGNISDRIGRRPVIILATILVVIAGIGVLAASSFKAFLIFRMLVGAGAIIVYETVLVLTVETVDPSYRCYTCLGYHIGWGFGCVYLGIVGWLLHGWLYIQGFVMVPSVALLRGLASLPESPRWLMATGRFDEAELAVSYAIKKNLPQEMAAQKMWQKLRRDLESVRLFLCLSTPIILSRTLVCLKAYDKSAPYKTASAFDLLRTPKLRSRTLILFYTWFAISFTYYAISLNVGRLAGNVYVSFLLSASVEVPAYLSTLVVLSMYKRKTTQSATLLCSAFACAGAALLREDKSWMAISFTLLGKFMIAAAFSVVSVYSLEIFPTVLRNVGMCYSAIFAKAAAAIAPFVKELGEATQDRVPYVLYVVLCGLSGLLVLLLPETKLAVLPDTVKEAEVSEAQLKRYYGTAQSYQQLEATLLN
ncbi:organic cation transporter protein-like isoform X2 [Ornithodoros turicata]|uniref:organic cation transporter protein-like isoform X2 n=1 Tax=Ornithodoros turicata TaxID=34597 RepID=UPI0031397AE9